VSNDEILACIDLLAAEAQTRIDAIREMKAEAVKQANMIERMRSEVMANKMAVENLTRAEEARGASTKIPPPPTLKNFSSSALLAEISERGGPKPSRNGGKK
jgi:capsular polysaccharide biosynthesis protein